MINIKQHLKVSFILKCLKLLIVFFLIEVWLFAIALILILFLRVFNKYFNIRFGKWRIDVIGNSIHNLDCYIGEKKLFNINSRDYFLLREIVATLFCFN